MERKTVTISTDGACSGNPGPGGCAILLRIGDYAKEGAFYESRTTNNRMELRACIEGVRTLKQPCHVVIRSDSTFVRNAIACLDDMPKTNYCTKTGAKRQNVDLLQQLYEAKHDGDHTLEFVLVKGHSGDADNERCDALAKEAIKLRANVPLVRVS